MAVDDRNRGFVHEPSQTFKTYFGKPERILDNIVVYFDLEKKLGCGGEWLWNRVARWPIFKPKISIWVNFGGRC
jgi:hypothetical protein